MRRYITYFVNAFLTLFLLSSCEQEQLACGFGGSNTLTLQLNTGALETRATTSGDDDLNENLISKVDIFLYPSNAADTENATCSFTASPNANAGTNGIDVSLTLTDDQLEALFGEGVTTGECKVYVVANYPGTLPTTTGTSIKVLKELTVTADFTDNTEEDNFVMDSNAKDEVTLSTSGTTKSLSGTVSLYRAAAKIGLFVKVEDTITDENGVTWKSQPSSMSMTFQNGVKTGYVGNDVNTYTPASGDFFSNTTARSVKQQETIGDGTYYTSEVPYYSYPWTWTADDADTPYITLTIPWQKKRESESEEWIYCRYQIPINEQASDENPNIRCMERNTYYEMRLNVGILGAVEETNKVELTPSYIAVPWGTETINATMTENCYLVVDDNYVVINNANEISVGYVASHPISIEIVSIVQQDISTVYPTDIKWTGTDSNDADDTYTVDADITGSGTANNTTISRKLLKACSASYDGSNVTLSHQLVNYGDDGVTLGTRFDLTPYCITVKVSMAVGSETYEETIVFVQYPAIYMEPMLNSDHASITSTSTNKGYVIVNDNKTASGDDQTFGTSTITSITSNEKVEWLGQVYGNFKPEDDDAGTKNPNMYVLTLSSFQSNTYLIGDPRVQTYEDVFQILSSDKEGTNDDADNDYYWDDTSAMKFTSSSYTVWAKANALYDGSATRRLKYYYGTDESEYTQNVIAPKIRFASSHSIPSPIVKTREMAKRRCAAYQEDGYPAGRWRLPTKAEVEFTMRLNNGGLIPHVFSTSLAYWSAHGYFDSSMNFNKVTSTTKQGSVRCVYDEWYWNDRLETKTTFTWGDYPREAYPPTN